MSLLSGDRVRVYLAPDRAVVIGSGKEILGRDSGADAGDAGSPAVFDRVGDLRQDLLPVFEGCDARGVEWVLSNHLVRYAVVPWTGELKRGKEDQAWIGIAFEEQYGETMTDKVMLASSNGFARNRLAAAVSGGLLEQLRETTKAMGKQVLSIEPLLMVEMNRWRHRTEDDRYFFVVAEPGKLAAVLIENGNYLLTRSYRYCDGLAEELPKLLKRESVLQAMAQVPRSYLCAARGVLAAPETLAESQVTILGEHPWEASQGKASHLPWIRRWKTIADNGDAQDRA